jgi:hypothetical protein
METPSASSHVAVIESRREAMPWPARAVIGILIALFVVQAWSATVSDSVTIDEFAHVPVGLYGLFTGDLSLDPINPPHTRMIAALPLLFHPPAFDPPPHSFVWGLGYHLMERNADHYHEVFLGPRAMILALAIALALLVIHWTGRLYGWRAALIAAFLYSFSPTMLAHGHLVTLDLSGALGFTATAFAIWRMLDRPSLGAAAAAGLALGVASLLKLSGFVLLAAVVAVVAVRMLTERDVTPARWAQLVAVVFATGLLVINAGYLFSGTFASLDRAELSPHGALAALRRAAPWLRLPLPLPFLNGIDMVMNVGKEREPSYFLAGTLSSEGWWYYHLAAFALKTSLPVLLLTIDSFVHWTLGERLGKREYAVWIPVLLLFVSNTLFNSLQIGVRHVLPVYPLLFVVIAARLQRLLGGWRSRGRKHVAASAVVLLLAWHAAGTIAVAPCYLQFFNEIAGGAEGGHRWLIDSNIDWGQDLIRLRDYMRKEHIDEVQLAYFGRVNPSVYGIRFRPLEPATSKGIGAVSATFLMGRPYFWILGGRMRWVPANTYAQLQKREPIARVGAMFIYRLD